MEDFTDPRGARLNKSALRRGWLLVLLVMAAFIALTKVFPSRPATPTTPPQFTGAATPSR
jgi:hypothetical protein